MNKLEEQFKEIIIKTAELDYNDESDYLVPFSSLTKDVAVKFAEWIQLTDINKIVSDNKFDQGGNGIGNNLFDYFITNIYKP